MFILASAKLSNPGGYALIADRASINGDLMAHGGFTAHGELSLVGAKVSGTINLDGAELDNHGASALTADRLTVGGNLLARHGFTADGQVRLIHIRVAGQLNFVDATLSHPNGFALHVGAGRVNDLWLVFAKPPTGQVRLSGLQAETIFDHPETWPERLNLVGCTYNQLHARRLIDPSQPMPTEPVDVDQRLAWLRRDLDGYVPQPYEQLAAVYRRTGHDSDARRVLLEKHRRRRDTLRWPGRLAGHLLDGLVGYGYRNWLAGVWLAAFWLLGTLAFTLDPPSPRNPAAASASNSGLYTLDLILPNHQPRPRRHLATRWRDAIRRRAAHPVRLGTHHCLHRWPDPTTQPHVTPSAEDRLRFRAGWTAGPVAARVGAGMAGVVALPAPRGWSVQLFPGSVGQ
jgi:hypothetical protein